MMNEPRRPFLREFAPLLHQQIFCAFVPFCGYKFCAYNAEAITEANRSLSRRAQARVSSLGHGSGW
jgi:hypothetical protein